MSKIPAETLTEAIDAILAQSKEKQRKFVETIELQVGLKNYDVNKEKRFSGQIKLPFIPRPKYKVCIMGDEKHLQEARAAGIPCMSETDLKKLNKDKKKVKKLAQEYHTFLASASLIRKIPRLLGPGLNKAGKFPSVIGANDVVPNKVNDSKAQAKFQLKNKKTLCLGVAIGNVAMKPEEINANIVLALNFLASLLPKNWQNIKRIYIKSTMGAPQPIFGF